MGDKLIPIRRYKAKLSNKKYKMGVFQRFVEIGRVAYVAFGGAGAEGKLVVIVDVLDQNRALVDGPLTGVKRQVVAFKQLHLTEHVIKIGPSSRSGVVQKAWEAAEISAKWQASTWAKKIESRQRRALVTDFERFKLMKAKQARNRLIATEMGKMRSALKKAGGKPKPKRVNRKPHLSARAQLHA